MPRPKALVASLAGIFLAVAGAAASGLTVAPCGELPAPVLALGAAADLEAFGLAADGRVAVASSPADGRRGTSVLKIARAGEPVRGVPLPGSVLGLAVADDGALAFAVVRATDRRGSIRSVDLVSVDLKAGRVATLTALPLTSRGVAISADGAQLLVACKDEIRSFKLPLFSSGPLYRVPGENVGVAPIAGSSRILVAQPSRFVVADLASAQGRDGLPLSCETTVTETITGMTGPVGDLGCVTLSSGGAALCVHFDATSLPQVPPVVETPPVAKAPLVVEAPPVAGVPPVARAPRESDSSRWAQPALAPRAEPPARAIEGAPGSVRGIVGGPLRDQVAAMVLLGPDNVLREAARAVPDDRGGFVASGLPPGSYRIVAAGRGGRVLLCDPPFITVRVTSDSAVEVQAMNVLRAP